MRPDFLRPCAALRANLRHAIQAAVRQNSLRAEALRSNSCRKFVHEATLSFGSIARSLNRVPQAHPHGWERTARKNFAEMGFKPNH